MLYTETNVSLLPVVCFCFSAVAQPMDPVLPLGKALIAALQPALRGNNIAQVLFIHF